MTTSPYLAFNEQPDYEAPRAWTAEEVRDKFFRRMVMLSDYWAKADLSGSEFPKFSNQVEETQYRIEGAMHSVCAMMEGRTLDLPSMQLVLSPHEDDKLYYISQGENWYEHGMSITEESLLTAFNEACRERKKRLAAA